MPSNSQSINIEGQDATNGFFKQQNQVNQAGVEAIQEVAIQTSNFAAEYGQAGGGYFNYTMKSGTNQLHGSGYDYFVNEALNAGLPFTNAGSTNPAKAGQHIRNPIRQNDYGFTLGGPIDIPKVYNGHDKTFFFFSFEQFRQSSVTTNTQSIVPTAAQRTGRFRRGAEPPPATARIRSGQMVCLNEDLRSHHQSDRGRLRGANSFPGNIIPATRIDPTAAIIQNMIPLPNTAGFSNYTAPGYSNFRHTTIPSVKIDQTISSKMKLAGYYSATKTFSPQTNGFAEPYTAAAAAERTGADHPPQPGHDAHANAAVAPWRGLSAHVQSSDRPHLQPVATVPRWAFPSRRASSSPIWRACTARMAAG